jgi:hypothetical protein
MYRFSRITGVFRRILPLTALLVLGLVATAIAAEDAPPPPPPLPASYLVCLDICRHDADPAKCVPCCDEAFPQGRQDLDRCIAEKDGCTKSGPSAQACEQGFHACMQRIEQVKRPFACGEPKGQPPLLPAGQPGS